MLVDRFYILFLKLTGDLLTTVKDIPEDRKAGFVDSLLSADKAGHPVKAEHHVEEENPVKAEDQEKTRLLHGGTDHNAQSVSKTSFLFHWTRLHLFNLLGIACGISQVGGKNNFGVFCNAVDANSNCLLSENHCKLLQLLSLISLT